MSAVIGKDSAFGLHDALLTAAVTQTQTSGRSTLDYLEEHSPRPGGTHRGAGRGMLISRTDTR
jgi:hypothetical protein